MHRSNREDTSKLHQQNCEEPEGKAKQSLGRGDTNRRHTENMQHTSDDVNQKQRAIRKKDQIGLARDFISQEKSQPCLQNEHQSGPKKDNTFSVSRSFVVAPSNKDILLGRGRSFFNHEGNKRFRDIVDKYIDPYIKAPRRSKRTEIVKAAVHETLGTGARFLKRSKNKLEWYDVGVNVASEKVGHALRDATSHKSQQLSKKMHLPHDQKTRQQTLKGKEQISKCDGSMVETLESKTFSILPHDSLLEAKEKPRRPRIRQYPFFEDAQMLTLKYDEHLPFEVENSIFSEASFQNDTYDIFSEKHEYGSVECNDAIDTSGLDMNDKVMICPPSIAFNTKCKEPMESLRNVTPAHLNGVQKPNLQYDAADFTVATTSIYSQQFSLTKFNTVFTNGSCHQDVKQFSVLTSSTSDIQENAIAPIHPQESFLAADRERTRKLFESSSKSSLNTQQPQMANFKNNKCNPHMRAALSIPSQSCAHSNFNKADSQINQNGNLEYFEQSSFATAQIQKELGIPIQSEDAMMSCNEPKAIPSDSIKNIPNNLDEFKKSDLSNAKRRNEMGSASSIISDPCHNAMLSEFGSKNHNRTQSCGSLDSSHIDTFNNMHLEELDSCLRTAFSLGNQDDSD